LTVVCTPRLHGVDHDDDQAVVEQQGVADLDLARQRLVVQPDCVDITELGTCRVQDERGAGLQHDLALGELAHPDLGALQVGHDGDLAPSPLRRLAHQPRAVDVVLRDTVAEVQPHHVHAGPDHLLEQGGIAGGRAEGGNNLGGAAQCHGKSPVWGRILPWKELRSGYRFPARTGRLCADATNLARADSALGALRQDLERRQGLALQHFQERTATGRDVADLLFDAVLGDRGQRVAATGDRERCAVGDGMRDRAWCRSRTPRTRTRPPGRSRRWCRPGAAGGQRAVRSAGRCPGSGRRPATSVAAFTVATRRP
jgi:hypothetical protein